MPASTRSSSCRRRIGLVTFALNELPDEITAQMARLLFEVDLTAALRLCRTCKTLHTKLEPLREEAGPIALLITKVQSSPSKGFQFVRKQKKLNWFNKGLTDSDCSAIACLLRFNVLSVQALHLSGSRNCLGDAGLEAIAGALREDSPLEALFLWSSSSRYGAAGLDALAAAMNSGKAPQLSEVEIAGNCRDATISSKLSEACRKRGKVLKFY